MIANHFTVQDVEMYLIIYPNGANDALRGKVFLLLANVSSKQVFLSCKFEIGDQEAVLDTRTLEISFFGIMNKEDIYSCRKVCPQ